MERRLQQLLALAACGTALLAAATPGSALNVKPPARGGTTAAPLTIGGVTWEASLERARVRAQREGKPVLLLQLFGRLDQEFC